MRHKYLQIFFLSLSLSLGSVFSKAQPVIRVDTISTYNFLYGRWYYKTGDNKEWANPAFDDKSWDTVHSDAFFIPQRLGFKDFCWFRAHLRLSPALLNKRFLLVVNQEGASEIYLNGKLIKSFGKVGDKKTEKPYNPKRTINYIDFGPDTVQVLAVRFSSSKLMDGGFTEPLFELKIASQDEINDIPGTGKSVAVICAVATVFFTLAMFHLILFLYYRKAISNLYYSFLAIVLAMIWIYPALQQTSHNPVFLSNVNKFTLYLFALCFFLIIILLYSIFKLKRNWVFWLVTALAVISLAAISINMLLYGISVLTLIVTSSIAGIVIVIRAVRKKLPGAWIIASGFFIFLALIIIVLAFLAFAVLFLHVSKSVGDNNGSSGTVMAFVFGVWVFSIPGSMSVYLASDFARTNKRLVLEIKHVQNLSEQNVEKEREKQQIIERQKEMLEVKVKEATAEISRQKDELSEKNKEITDSINYARRIQTSILPEDELFLEALGEYIVLYKPKDVVSGDFYWCHSAGDKVIFAVADCTGHGVPGAFMSMIGNSLLNEIVIAGLITEANTILDNLRSKLIITLQQSAQHITTRDGMDIALCVWDKKTNMLQFAGANNSLYLVSKNIAKNGSVKHTERVKLHNDHLLEILPDKQPIGYQEDKMNNPFTKNIIQLHKGDTIFIASDGYTDQFGGEKNKKFTTKRFRELIDSLIGLPLEEQQRILELTIEDWKKNEAQTDDICLMGVRV